MSPYPNLTFGIELEFICVIDPNGFPICRVGADGARAAGPAIFDGFRDAGVPVTGYEPDDEDFLPVPEYSLWRVESDYCHLSPAEHEAVPEGYVIETVELSSRKFHFFLEDWRAEIQAVLDVLARLEAQGARFITNHTTGMHVHVGLAGSEGRISLRTAKNVMQLATAFERLFDQLHSSDGIAYPQQFAQDWFHTPLSWWHKCNGKTGKEAMLYDWLASVEDQQTYAGLGSLFTVSEAHQQKIDSGRSLASACGHNSTHNFDNLFTDPSACSSEANLTNTIEFRQHTGCLDFVEISAWILTVCQLVLYSHTAGDVEMLALCAHGTDMEFTLHDLLSALGCHQDIIDHYVDASDSSTLGFLRKHSIHPKHDCDFSDLDACNDDETTQQTDPLEHSLTAMLKDYGFDASTANVIDIPLDAVAKMYQNACQAMAMAHLGASREVVTSKARSAVFGLLARIYSGEADEYVRMCEEAGLPYVYIGSRSGDVMEDDDIE